MELTKTKTKQKQTKKQTRDIQGAAEAELPSLLGWSLKEVLILLETPEAWSSCFPWFLAHPWFQPTSPVGWHAPNTR